METQILKSKIIYLLIPAIGVVIFFTGLFVKAHSFPKHENITTTIFWIGEPDSKENSFISNVPSAWDEDWVNNFGGIDDPVQRNGFNPANFEPKENPFYAALPYNDFDENGNRKILAKWVIPWSDEKQWGENESMVKNQWVKITKNGNSAYAQWEDAGPFGENDFLYVFGKFSPMNRKNKNAGLDVSPAVRDYLQLSDIDKTEWEFVSREDVPDGPWTETITTSQVNWK